MMPQKALANIDWGQVVANGGPPCFHVEDGRFCLRAERWDGHRAVGFHSYVSLEAAWSNQLERNAEWQDISTAPKDGTPLWLWDGLNQFEGYWQSLNTSGLSGWAQKRCSGCYVFVDNVSHWLPLPVLPKPPEAK